MYRFVIRFCFLLALVATVAIGSNLTVQAQEMPLKFRTGFGASFPMYDPGEGAENKIGWTGIGALEYVVHPNVGLFIEGYYADHGFGVEDTGESGDGYFIDTEGLSGSVSAIGANAGILLQGTSSPALYGFAGAGVGQEELQSELIGVEL